jgi:hypothetical protein
VRLLTLYEKATQVFPVCVARQLAEILQNRLQIKNKSFPFLIMKKCLLILPQLEKAIPTKSLLTAVAQ